MTAKLSEFFIAFCLVPNKQNAVNSHLPYIGFEPIQSAAQNPIAFGYYPSRLAIKTRNSGEFWSLIESGIHCVTRAKLAPELIAKLWARVAIDPNSKPTIGFSNNYSFKIYSRKSGLELWASEPWGNSFRHEFKLADLNPETIHAECAALYCDADLQAIEQSRIHREFVQSFIIGDCVNISAARQAGINVVSDKYGRGDELNPRLLQAMRGNDSAMRELYLQYVNEYLTVAGFAAFYGISAGSMAVYLEWWREAHESHCAKSKGE